jgi:predicted O-methyltransferase YrrM
VDFSSQKAAALFDRLVQRHENERKKMRAARREGRPFERDLFLLPVGPNVARFLHSLILSQRPKLILELGTSYGYSTLILADAASQTGGRLITIESENYKQAHAQEIIDEAGLSQSVEFILGDAVEKLAELPGPFDLALLDIWKEMYVPCFEALYPKLADESIVIADNMIEPESARENAREYRAAVQARPDLQTVLIPIGSGIELSCKWPAGHPKL